MRRSLRDRLHLTRTVAPGAPQRGPRNGSDPDRHRRAALGILLAIAGAVAFAVAQVAVAGRPHPMVGHPLPSLGLSTVGPCAERFTPPAVILYISVDCPHCRAQLQAWDHMLAESRGPAPWVVLAPGETAGPVVPTSMHRRVVLDLNGHIARLLEVGRVPMTLYAAGDRSVVARVEGRQGGAEMTRLLNEAGFDPPFPPPRNCR